MEHEVVAAIGEPLERLGRRAPDHAVHLVSLGEQELREIGAVLARHAGYERALGHATAKSSPPGLSPNSTSRNSPM